MIEIFSTSVHLQVVQCTINGITQHRWVATDFEDESYLNAKSVLSLEYSDNINDILEYCPKLKE